MSKYIRKYYQLVPKSLRSMVVTSIIKNLDIENMKNFGNKDPELLKRIKWQNMPPWKRKKMVEAELLKTMEEEEEKKEIAKKERREFKVVERNIKIAFINQ